MDKLKILIVEDEMIIAESISDMLEELGYEVTNICIRARQALELIQASPPDLALFDIRLKGEETGIWLAQQIKDRNDFPFIFLTSYGDKATIDQAVNMSPYGYLLKPVEKQHLYGAIEVAMRRFSEGFGDNGNEAVVIRDSFFVKEDHQYVKVKISDVDYIKSDDNYLEIYASKRRHLVRSTLKVFLDQLPPKQFLQLHRSYVVNVQKIVAFGPTSVEIEGTEIPVSRQYKDVLQQHVNTIN
ncbi:MAG: LytTR family transcriptional regulator DNA-binding domain-containing protein [Cyclobacteriaceae bacterium]